MKENSLNKRSLVILIIILVDIPAALLISWKMGDRKYYLFSVIVMILSMLPLFIRFENRKPSAKELVTLAVMTAIAVAARAAFIFVPHFRPMIGIIMITGISLGAEAGFLTGAIGAFVSNFIVGQGPFTPWQMFAYGLAGFIMGKLAEKGAFDTEKRFPVALTGGLLVLCLIGPILDTCTIFIESAQISGTAFGAVYAAGLPVNAVHGLATFITLFLLCRPIKEKLDRLRSKYGIMEADESGRKEKGDKDEI